MHLNHFVKNKLHVIITSIEYISIKYGRRSQQEYIYVITHVDVIYIIQISIVNILYYKTNSIYDDDDDRQLEIHYNMHNHATTTLLLTTTTTTTTN